MAWTEEAAVAIADQLRAALANAPWDFQVEPGMVVAPTTPSLDVWPGDAGRDSESAAFAELYKDAAWGWFVSVRARVAPNDIDANQSVLFELSSPDSEWSVVQALYDDPTLGGIAADLELSSETGFRPIPTWDGGALHIGVIWTFLVIPATS